jgi:hypothetical protein
MSNDLKKLAALSNGSGTNTYSTWRLRDLTEEQAFQAQADMEEHLAAMRVVEKKLSRGDIQGAVVALEDIQTRLSKTIELLK